MSDDEVLTAEQVAEMTDREAWAVIAEAWRCARPNSWLRSHDASQSAFSVQAIIKGYYVRNLTRSISHIAQDGDQATRMLAQLFSRRPPGADEVDYWWSNNYRDALARAKLAQKLSEEV